MNYNEIKSALSVFDDFVNKGISAKLDIDTLEVVTSYNTIRNFINEHIEFDKE